MKDEEYMSDSTTGKQSVISHAYLKNIVLTDEKEGNDTVMRYLEITVIPNVAKIRRIQAEDIEGTSRAVGRPDMISFKPEENIILEWKHNDDQQIYEANSFSEKILFALRLLNNGSVYITNRYNYINDNKYYSDKILSLAVPHPEDGFRRLYKLDISDEQQLQKIVNQVLSLDFKKEISYRIASERFSPSI